MTPVFIQNRAQTRTVTFTNPFTRSTGFKSISFVTGLQAVNHGAKPIGNCSEEAPAKYALPLLCAFLLRNKFAKISLLPTLSLFDEVEEDEEDDELELLDEDDAASLASTRLADPPAAPCSVLVFSDVPVVVVLVPPAPPAPLVLVVLEDEVDSISTENL